MNILHLATERAWRGGENQLRFLMSGLNENSGFMGKHHIAVQPSAILAERFGPYGHVHTLRMRNDVDLTAVYKISRIVVKQSISLIHAHSARGHSLGLLVLKLLRITNPSVAKKVRLIVHRRVEQTGQLSLIERAKYLSEDVSHYICVSKAIARGLIQCGVPAHKISVIYSSVDPAPHQDHQNLRLSMRDEFGFRESETVVCCVAAMEQAKGISYLLEGWSQLIARLKNANKPLPKLVLVGGGPLTEPKHYQSYLTSDGLASTVFTGFRSDVPRLMAGSDIIVLPTLWEGLGTVLLDGILAGCAPIASNVGGVPEIIQDQVTGLLVSPANSQALTHALEDLCQNPEKRVTLVDAGQKHIARHFSLENLIRTTLNTYKALSQN